MTDNINSDISATSTTAKWKGRNKDLAPWFIPFADALEKHPTYGHFLKTRTKSLNNGKTAVDSKAAISAMLSGKHEILTRRSNARTPYPPGMYIDDIHASTRHEPSDYMASPSKYQEFATTKEESVILTAEQLEHYVINPMTIKNLEFDLFNYCLDHVSDERIRRELDLKYKNTSTTSDRRTEAWGPRAWQSPGAPMARTRNRAPEQGKRGRGKAGHTRKSRIPH